MDLGAVRTGLAGVALTAGFNAWSFVPDDPQHLPAAVVGGVVEMKRLNRVKTQVMLPVTLIASAADLQDATWVLDRALSTGNAGSLIDELDGVAPTAWDTARFDSAGPYTLLAIGEGQALSVQLQIEFIA